MLLINLFEGLSGSAWRQDAFNLEAVILPVLSENNN